jgi:hypothetical protein
VFEMAIYDLGPDVVGAGIDTLVDEVEVTEEGTAAIALALTDGLVNYIEMEFPADEVTLYRPLIDVSYDAGVTPVGGGGSTFYHTMAYLSTFGVNWTQQNTGNQDRLDPYGVGNRNQGHVKMEVNLIDQLTMPWSLIKTDAIVRPSNDEVYWFADVARMNRSIVTGTVNGLHITVTGRSDFPIGTKVRSYVAAWS